MSAVFSRLHPRIREGLQELGITEPTPPQEKAIGPIMEGENVLLIAPTASGKTEAALLPVFSALLEEPQPPGGIEVVYITPLRALNRDIHKRMMYWADRLGVTVQVRHGDTSQRDRRRQSAKPPRFIITTPETLQAILPTKAMRDHLKTVRWVIVDEIHDLAASKRGVQLTIGLEKVAEGPVQRIGLSATVGNPDEVAGFLGGIHPVNVIEVEVDKVYSYDVEFPEAGEDDFDLASDLSTSPEAAARLRRILDLIEGKKSTLVFVQGRGQAESLGHKLGRMEPLIEVPPGSLDELRIILQPDHDAPLIFILLLVIVDVLQLHDILLQEHDRALREHHLMVGQHRADRKPHPRRTPRLHRTDESSLRKPRSEVEGA
jgi:ATP-dependent Lhr-like helicase